MAGMSIAGASVATTVLVGFFVSKNMDSLEDAMYEALEEKTEAEVELS